MNNIVVWRIVLLAIIPDLQNFNKYYNGGKVNTYKSCVNELKLRLPVFIARRAHFYNKFN